MARSSKEYVLGRVRYQLTQQLVVNQARPGWVHTSMKIGTEHINNHNVREWTGGKELTR